MTESANEAGLSKVIRALAFAAHKHRDQRRKDPEASPYVNHPIALAAILADEAGVTDVDTLCAAILHDTVEDTQTSEAEIREAFGNEIANVVAEVTDDKSLPKDVRKQLQIDHAPHLSRKARLVKLADKIANLRDMAASPPADWPLERRRDYFEWGAKVVAGIRGSHPVLEALFDEAYEKRP